MNKRNLGLSSGVLAAFMGAACSSPTPTTSLAFKPDIHVGADIAFQTGDAQGKDVGADAAPPEDAASAGCKVDADCVGVQVATCQKASCVTGKCGAVDAEAGTACDDKDACTDSDQCKSGTCVGLAKNCDDQSVCTSDACNPSTGKCDYTPNTAKCDDGDLCTENDACKDGKCQGTPASVCGCTTDADCAKTDDADQCNGIHTCQSGQCLTKPGSEITCDTSKAGPCATIACEPKDGTCRKTPLAAGTQCDDSSQCTKSDACSGTTCKGKAVVCDDNNPCTDDSCDKATGCVYKPNSATCSDGDLCTNDDKCAEGKCAGTANPNCSKCATDDECAKFEDGDLCNGTLVCKAGVCAVKDGSAVTCAADPNPCLMAACEPTTGKCGTKNALTGAKCDDTDACTTGDHCDAGACVGGKDVSCADGNPCTIASCDKVKGCVFAPSDGAACDDGNPCTTSDKCAAAKCGGTQNPNCLNCKADADCSPAEDADLCSGTLMCQGGMCVVNPATVVTCDTQGLSSCIKVECVAATGKCKKTTLDNGAACDDQNACTAKDYCSTGICKGAPLNCDDGQLCTDDACDPDAGCTHKFNASPCDDGNACTAGDACKNGACGGSPVEACSCKANSDCVDDGDKCNGTPICVSSKCVVDPKTIVSCAASKDACSPNVCDTKTGTCAASPQADGKPCDDKNACTSADACAAGQCKGGAVITCDDTNVCTTDKCKPEFGCTYASNTVACDDGNKCTSGDTCAYGQCQPGKPVDTNQCKDKCVPGLTLSCGDSDSWSNGEAGSTDIITQYACNLAEKYDGPEYAYVYVAPFDGTVTVTLSNETAETDIFLLDATDSGCDAKACLAWGYASATTTVKAGKTYYVVVDGFLGATGKYNVDVSCVPAIETACTDGIDEDQDGATDCSDSDCQQVPACVAPACDAAYTLACGQVDSWSNYSFGSTNVINNYLGCSSSFNYPGPEYTYAFIAKASGKVTVTLTDESAATDVIVLTDDKGVCNSSKCLDYGLGSVTFDAVAGSTYYFVVDGYNGAEGTYTIAVDCPTAATSEVCDDSKDNDTDGKIDCEDSDCFGKSAFCQPACVPDSVSLAKLTCPSDADSYHNDGLGSTDAITAYSCNPTMNYSGEEYAYTFVATANGSVTVTLTNETATNKDTDLLVLQDTGLGCNPASCIATGMSSATFTAKKDVTYYIVIDGYKGAKGKYDLTFTCQ